MPGPETEHEAPEEGREPRRRAAPRPSRRDLALLRWLCNAPKPVTMGPIGICVRNGWCEPLIVTVVEGGTQRSTTVYRLTQAGLDLLESCADEVNS